VFQGADIKSDLSFSNTRKTTGLNPTPSRALIEEDIGSDPRETENATLL
jgi:hypothetical protein